MATSLLEEIVAESAALVCRLNVDQLHQMLAAGVIDDGEPVELIDGLLVYKDRCDSGGKPMSHGPRHATSVRRLAALDQAVQPAGYHVRTQLPVVLSEVSEPEPDAAIVRGRESVYSERHPTAADVAVVFEVADTSLQRDRGIKQRVYSRAGVPVYVIVNLTASVVEVHREPVLTAETYREQTVLSSADTLQLELDGAVVEVPVAELLP